MKILALRGARLGALVAPFALNFNAPPLKNCGLFAITGATGAGKSTLLDALCLALYNNSPRLEKSEQKNWENGLSAGDSRTLLHKNAVDAFAEVDFVGVDQENYRARWSVRRAHGKLEGALQKVEMRLEKLPSGELVAQGAREALLAIQNKIGLTFQQFTKTVLLAQNDFAHFLEAKDDARAEILQTLSGGEIYQKISIKAFEKCKESETRLKVLKEEQEGKIIPTKEEQKELEAELKNILEKKRALTAEKEKLEKIKTWAEEKNNLEKRFQSATNAFLEIEKKFKEKEGEFQHLERQQVAYHLEAFYLNLKKLKENFLENESEMENNQNYLENTKIKIEEAEENFKKSEIILNDFIKNFQKEAKRFEEVKTLDDSILSLSTELKTETEFLNDFILENEDLKKQLLSLENAFKQKEEAFKEIESWLNIKQKHKKLNAIWENVQDFLKIPFSENLKKLKTECENKEMEFLEFKNKTCIAQKNWENTKENFNLAQKEVKNQTLLELSLHLYPNEVCPLCGSKEHPQPFILEKEKLNLAEKDLTSLKKECEEKEKLFRQLEKECFAKENHFSVAKNNLQNVYNDWENHLKIWDIVLKEMDTEWQNKFLNDSLSFFQKAKNSVEHYQAKLKNKEDLEKEKAFLYEQKNSAFQKLFENEKKLKEERNKLQIKEEKIAFLKNKRQAFWEGKSLLEVQKDYNEQHHFLKDNQNKAWREKEDLKTEYERLFHFVEELKEKNSDLQLKISNAEKELNQKMAEHHLDFNTLKHLLSKPKKLFEEEWINFENLKRKRSEAEFLMNERQKDLNQHQNIFKSCAKSFEEVMKEWEVQNALLQELERAESQKKAQQGEMEKQLKEAEVLAVRLKEAQKNLALWKGIADLIGSATGKKFRNFAQENTLDLLLYSANQHLQFLWKRYVLVRAPGSLTLGIKDSLLGSLRSVYSLSGGESFLVSLSLALGLANLSNAAIDSDTLFIDEGFGALDKNSLDLVMSALENLESAGRTVGVISHIEAMQERIAVRVLVKREGESSVVQLENSF